jgi:hypothetical protein
MGDERTRIVLDSDRTKDPRLAKKWCTKKEAIANSRVVPGYGPSDVTRIEIMGYVMWGLTDYHMTYLSTEGFERWAEPNS